MKAKLIMWVLLCISYSSMAQYDESFWNPQMKEIAEGNSSPGWITFKKSTNITTDNLFVNYKKAFQLSPFDEMRIISSVQDELGFTHTKFQQYYKGIKVEGCEYNLHEREGRLESANGKLAIGLNINLVTNISEGEALITAMSEIKAMEYEEIPAGEKVLVRLINNKDYSSSNYSFGYKFELESIHPFEANNAVYISCDNKKLIKSDDLHSHSSSTLTTNTYFNGPKYIKGTAGFIQYRLEDTTRGGGIITKYSSTRTYNPNTGVEGNGTSSVIKSLDTDFDGNPNTPFEKERIGGSAHWAAEMTFDYFSNIHNYQSFDGNNAQVIIEVNRRVSNWDGSSINLADDTYNTEHAVSLDNLGHEFTHAINDYTANLDGTYESGAIQESFANIFGEMVEYYTTGSCNYVTGDEYTSGIGINNLNHPDATYKDYLYNIPSGQWHLWTDLSFAPTPTFANDYGYIHDNDYVHDYWFYLLAEGGSGINRAGTSYNVQAIGKTAAAAIAFRNLTVYLTSTSQYVDARIGALKAASDLYGACSNEYAQTLNAWNAVEVNGSEEWTKNVDCTHLNQIINNTGTYIGASTSILQSNCNIPSYSGGVILQAAKRIRLTQGFHVDSDFWAFLNPCTDMNSGYKTTPGNQPKFAKDFETPYEEATSSVEIISGFSLYPNPSNGQFTLEVFDKGLENLDVNIFNSVGKLVFSKKEMPVKTQINMEDFPKGVYLVKVINGELNYSEKIVIH